MNKVNNTTWKVYMHMEYMNRVRSLNEPSNKMLTSLVCNGDYLSKVTHFLFEVVLVNKKVRFSV